MKLLIVFFIFYAQLYLGSDSFLNIVPYRLLAFFVALSFLINIKVIIPKIFIVAGVTLTLWPLLSSILYSNDPSKLIISLISNNLINFIFILLFVELWYSKKRLQFIFIIISLLMINVFVIIGQFYYSELFINITHFFAPQRFIDFDFERHLTKHGSITGALGEVQSGYANITLIGLLLYYRNNYNNYKILTALFIFFTLGSVFILGQRSSTIGILFILITYLLTIFNQKQIKYYLFGIILILISDQLIQFITNRINLDKINFNTNEREIVYLQALSFIKDNLIIPGGLENFYAISDNKSPHNLFYSVLIQGGVFLLFYLLYFLKRIVFTLNYKFILSLTFLVLILASFVHNHGILSFELFTWSLMMIAYMDSKKGHTNKFFLND